MRFEELTASYGVQIRRPGEHHHTRKGWIQLDCPFCGTNTGKFHLGWNINGQYFNCYRCGKVDASETISKLLDVPEKQAYKLLKSIDGGYQNFTAVEKPINSKLILPHGLADLKPMHRDYLARRGFDPDWLIETYGLKGIGFGYRLAYRIFIPIFSKDGKMVSWTTRTISKKESLRYI